MKIKKLGRQGLEVSELGLGTMGMTSMLGFPGLYGKPDEAEATATVHRAVELGVTLFDTAEIYGPFENETFLGKVLAGKRDRVKIATKFGFTYSGAEVSGKSSSAAHIKETVDKMLTRLGADHIDLLYQHRLDPDTPIEETAEAVGALVQEGKVGYFGLCEVSAETVRRAHAVHPLTAVQTEYSLWEREPETKILPTLRELGIGFVPYSPLGRGFLTGAVKQEDTKQDYRAYDPRFKDENFDRNASVVEALKHAASELDPEGGVTPAQVALAWLLAQGDDIVPIPGTKRRKYLEDNVQSTALSLSPEIISRLTAAATDVAGARYAEQQLEDID